MLQGPPSDAETRDPPYQPGSIPNRQRNRHDIRMSGGKIRATTLNPGEIRAFRPHSPRALPELCADPSIYIESASLWTPVDGTSATEVVQPLGRPRFVGLHWQRTLHVEGLGWASAPGRSPLHTEGGQQLAIVTVQTARRGDGASAKRSLVQALC